MACPCVWAALDDLVEPSPVGACHPSRHREYRERDPAGQQSDHPIEQRLVERSKRRQGNWQAEQCFAQVPQRVVQGGRHRSLDRGRVIAGARTAFGRVLQAAGLEEYVRTRGSWQWQ